MEVPPSRDTMSTRRRFLGRLSVGLSLLAGALVGIPVVGFITRSLFRRVPQRWRDIGSLDDFPVGTTLLVSFENAHVEQWAEESGNSGAWVRHEMPEDFTAFSTNCTHLGCPVLWQAKAGLFLCPCHGGVYHDDGSVASGPPLHPLVRLPVRVSAGRVEIGTSPIVMA